MTLCRYKYAANYYVLEYYINNKWLSVYYDYMDGTVIDSYESCTGGIKL